MSTQVHIPCQKAFKLLKESSSFAGNWQEIGYPEECLRNTFATSQDISGRLWIQCLQIGFFCEDILVEAALACLKAKSDTWIAQRNLGYLMKNEA